MRKGMGMRYWYQFRKTLSAGHGRILKIAMMRIRSGLSGKGARVTTSTSTIQEIIPCAIPPALCHTSSALPGRSAATVAPSGASRAPSGARLRSFERRGGGPRRLWQSSESMGEGEEG